MKILSVIFLLSCICLSFSNEQSTSFNKKSTQGEWLVQAIHMDKDYYKPNAYLMEF
ncbi:hypothetical protein [uncultured Aquimarina sp.]|uniref:hypothetical protein n=1 Tax=uncultured Aquimarina sp. TaxID=575652 RepID=UPI002634A17E|nr:hypothetical protein [uncultured Aquimarina sp.]